MIEPTVSHKNGSMKNLPIGWPNNKAKIKNMKEAITIFFIGLNLKFTKKIKTLKPTISVTIDKLKKCWLYGKKIQ